MFHIMQFRQHYPRDKQNVKLISIIILKHKPKVFVEINGPLSSVNFNNKFFHFFMSNTNTIHVISEKIKLHGRL